MRSTRLVLQAAAGVALLMVLVSACILCGAAQLLFPSRPAGLSGQLRSASSGVVTQTAAPLTSEQHRDALAAAPMAVVAADAAQPTAAAPTQGPHLTIEPGTRRDALGVRTGYPHSEVGAIGQLAAIERAVFEHASSAFARDVYAAWAVPGAPAEAQWGVQQRLDQLLRMELGVREQEPAWAAVQFFPAAAQTKANDGPDWTVACVLVQLRVDARGESRSAFGFCQRMCWVDDRWLIDAGTPAAVAPSVWPGSSQAYVCGWRDWIDGPMGEQR